VTVALTNTIALLASIAAGLVLTAAAVRLAPRFNLVVHPRLFGRSERSITFLGGPVLAASAICVYLVLGEPSPVITVLLIASLAAMVLGFLDDLLSAREGLTPRTRLVVEFVIAGAAWFAGLSAVTTAPTWLDFAITVIFLVGGMNAFNLIDNMDGVAGVTAMAVAFGVAAFALAGRLPQYALLSICLGGASLAFLCFNFKNPKAYLGDAGSLFLGMSLSGMALTIDAGFRPPGNFLVALVIFAVPFTDTVTRQLSRWVSGGSVFDIVGSTDHLSHRLVGRGFSPSEVASLHGIAGLFATAAAGISALYLLASPMLLTLGAFAAFGLLFVWDAWRGSRSPAAEQPRVADERLVAPLPIECDPVPVAGESI
jgi:UDP-GlcNAc:undecaprenyl-phosphate/decaprenyl-phosphate GlcNAc-1-phosphate transferase